MSFISKSKGQGYEPGYFLANDESCVRETKQIAESGATTADNGAKYVKMGTVYPSNDSNAIGIVYEDVDVTYGDMPGSVVTKGKVIKDRLAEEITADAITALTAAGFTFVDTVPAVTRPEFK